MNMERNWLIKEVKYESSDSNLTFIEHAIRTFHVGRYLYDQIRPKLDQAEFLYGCFFHDAGKLVAVPGEPHTPKTRESLASIARTREYETIIKTFDLSDLARNDRVIRAIERHHDSEDELSAYISMADQIASSESDENLKNRLRESPISTLITYLNEMHDFSEKHFYHVRFYSFSKNELNAVGRLILLKLLYETIEQIPDTKLLYETLDGCRVVTKLDPNSLKRTLSTSFNSSISRFVESQNLDSILGGAPDNYSQFTNLPREMKSRLIELTVKKYMEDIVSSLRKKKIEKIEDVGLSFEILSDFVKLEDVSRLAKNGIRGTSKTKYHLFADENGLFPKWIVDTFFSGKGKDKLKRKTIGIGKPLIEKFLSNAGADVSKITCKEEVYSKLFPLVVATNSLQESKIDFRFDIGDYLAIDDEISIEKIAKENPCANCGAFEGEVELTPFVFEYKQHAKETLFKETEDEFRHREKVICGLCQIEAVFNTLLCGTRFERMQARVDTRTHLIICGLGIDETLFEKLSPEEPIKKLIERFRITKQSVYTKKRNDLQFLVMSIADAQAGSGNITFQQLLFSWLATKLKHEDCLVLALGVNKVPTTIDDSIIQSGDGETHIIDDVRTDFFEYVFTDSNLPFKQQRDVILQNIKNPFIGIAQIFKKSNLKYTNQTKELVQKMSKDDELFNITDQIWEMAKIGGSLETRKNVGSFLVGFNGTPRSIDLIANRMLKNTMLSAEKRAQIIEIHEKLRDDLEKINDKQRMQLKDYVQRTKHLFNSKKFYELRLKGEPEQDEPTE
jgi:hypothetical protein